MWTKFEGSDKTWSKLVSDQLHPTYLHDTSWAEHMARLNWQVDRWVFKNGDEVQAILQGFTKVYRLGIGIMWFPDWMHGDLSITKDFGEMARNKLGLKFLYIRFRSSIDYSVDDLLTLLKNGWHPPKRTFSDNLTMILDISEPWEKTFAKFSSNWRRTYKKANSSNYRICQTKDANDIVSAYAKLQQTKRLRREQTLSETTIKSIVDAFGDNILIMSAKSETGEVLCIRGAIIANSLATEVFAASGTVARSQNLSHAVFVELLKEIKNIGLKKYDVGGISPQQSMGVFNFKNGTRARAKQLLGEFEWSNSKILTLIVNAFSKYR